MKLPSQLSPTLFSDPAQSPTERFLRSGPAPEAVRAALEGGWLNVSDLMATHPDRRVPALAEWAKENRFVVNAGLFEQGLQWPREPGDGRLVDWHARGNGEHTALGVQAEWLVGWCVSQIPPGGLPCWPVYNPHHGAQGFQSHLLGLAVQNRWTGVAEQLLERSDRLAVEEWNRVVGPTPVHARSSGQPYADPIQLPVMHLALDTRNHALIELLLRAGLDANQTDALGLPAVYRAKDVRSVELLLEHGLNPHKKPTHGESLVEWWARELKSTEEAMRLMAPINRWLVANEDPEQTRLQRLPDVARLLTNGTLSALKKELTQLKVPRHSTWEEQGQTWSLARKALMHCLERSPVIGNTSAALDFGLASGPLGEPLMGQAPNACLLWLVSQFNGASRTRLAKEFPGFSPSQEDVRALGSALMEWKPAPPTSLRELPKSITKERLEWALALGTACVLRTKAFEKEPLDSHPSPALWAFVRGHTGFALQKELIMDGINQSLLKAEQEREAGNLEESGRWVAEALLLVGGLRPEDAIGQGPFAEKLADRQTHVALPGIQLVNALEEASRAGARVGNPSQIQRIDAWFERAGDGVLGKALWPHWRQARLNQTLEESAPAQRRPRM